MTEYAIFVDRANKLLLVLAAIAGAICIIDWMVRTRRIAPFSPVARMFRRTIDPLLRPIEHIVVRRGGMPQSAPLWMFGVIIVGGILIMELLKVGSSILFDITLGSRDPGRIPQLVASWAIWILIAALLVRVVSSFLPVSPYSPWVRWSYRLTDWMLVPLRRWIPPFGPIDITPVIAYFALRIVAALIGG
jgi:YggT family protein